MIAAIYGVEDTRQDPLRAPLVTEPQCLHLRLAQAVDNGIHFLWRYFASLPTFHPDYAARSDCTEIQSTAATLQI